MLQALDNIQKFLSSIIEFITSFFSDVIELITLMYKAISAATLFTSLLPIQYQVLFTVILAYFTIYFIVKFGG